MFALSGAVLAARLRQTFVTMAFFALVTGVGGGTVRDLLIRAPVFWIDDPWVAAVCLATALIAWFTPVKLVGRQGHSLCRWCGAGGLCGCWAVPKALAYGVAARCPPRLWGVNHRLRGRDHPRCGGEPSLDHHEPRALRYPHPPRSPPG